MKKVNQYKKRKIHGFRILGYLLFYGMTWFLCYYFSGYFLFLILCYMTIFPLVSVTISYNLKKRIEITIQIEDRFSDSSSSPNKLGKDLTLLLKLRNPTIWPSLSNSMDIMLANSFYHLEAQLPLSASVGPLGTQQIRLPLHFDRSGLVSVMIKQVETKDLLGWISWHKMVMIQDQYLILPQSLEEGEQELKNLYLDEEKEDTSDSKISRENFVQFGDIREYHNGDRMKDIHWKRYALKEELFVIEREAQAEAYVTLLLSLEGLPEYVDFLLQQVWTLCNKMVETVPIRLLWWCGSQIGFEQAEIISQKEIADVFALVYVSGRREIEYNLRQAVPRLLPDLKCYFFLQAGEEPVLVECDG